MKTVLNPPKESLRTGKSILMLVIFSSLFFFFTTGCGPQNDETHPGANCTAKPTGQFFSLSDIHFDPYYDSTIVMQLVKSDVQGWEAIFKSSQLNTYSPYGVDANYLLMSSAFSAMNSQNAHPDFITITGDFLSHKFQADYVHYTGITNTDSLHSFITKTTQFIAMELGKSFPGVPIYPVLGNNDDFCGDYMIQPNDPFLPVFANAWAPFLDSAHVQNTFAQTVPSGGYYTASLPGYPNHVIIGLNSIFFSPKDTTTCMPVDTNGARTELNWLATTLANCKQQNQKVWLTCHIPPGADVYSSLKHQGNVVQCEDHIKMMWRDEYLMQFLALENQYKDVIVAGLGGHTHMDDFRIITDTSSASISFFHISPSISPIDGNNPSFELFTYDTTGMTLQNFTKYVFQGLTTTGSATWTEAYDFNKTYGINGINAMSLSTVWNNMYQQPAVRHQYLLNYDGGQTQASPDSALWKPYWCGVGDMTQDAFSGCACGAGIVK